MANEQEGQYLSPREHEDTALKREWLRTDEAMLLCGLGRTKIWELGVKKQIKTAKVGRAVRYSRRSILDFMEQAASRE